MKVFIVYDETGRIYGVEYGEKTTVPAQMNFVQSEVPDGAQINWVDVSDPDNPQITYTESKETALEKQIQELNAQIEYLSMMSGITEEV